MISYYFSHKSPAKLPKKLWTPTSGLFPLDVYNSLYLSVERPDTRSLWNNF